jgi:hypothetical protein
LPDTVRGATPRWCQFFDPVAREQTASTALINLRSTCRDPGMNVDCRATSYLRSLRFILSFELARPVAVHDRMHGIAHAKENAKNREERT